jgi:hypothetical protein
MSAKSACCYDMSLSARWFWAAALKDILTARSPLYGVDLMPKRERCDAERGQLIAPDAKVPAVNDDSDREGSAEQGRRQQHSEKGPARPSQLENCRCREANQCGGAARWLVYLSGASDAVLHATRVVDMADCTCPY